MSADYATYPATEDSGYCDTCHGEMPIGSLVLRQEGAERLCEACARALVASSSNWPGATDDAEYEEYAAEARAMASALGIQPTRGAWPWIEEDGE